MKKVKFVPKSYEAELLVPKPLPANKYMPDWYKKMPVFKNNKIEIDSFNGRANLTAKACVPFSDSFSMGYIVETWCDINIESGEDEESINYAYSSSPQIIEHRDSTTNNWSDSYYKMDFAWKLQWIPQLPSGYSMLYTHPFNRPELPFLSLTGIVDSDRFNYEGGANHPFLIKKGFSGIIPAGTPFLQMIPFKRDNWASEFEDHNEKNQLKAILPRKYFWGGYKKMFWNKKVFK
jgi:hypothetical protein